MAASTAEREARVDHLEAEIRNRDVLIAKLKH